MTSLSIDKSQRFRPIVKLKASSIQFTDVYQEAFLSHVDFYQPLCEWMDNGIHLIFKLFC